MRAEVENPLVSITQVVFAAVFKRSSIVPLRYDRGTMEKHRNTSFELLKTDLELRIRLISPALPSPKNAGVHDYKAVSVPSSFLELSSGLSL